MPGHKDIGDHDVVARRALEAERVPGIDDLDLGARQGEIAVRVGAAIVDEGGERHQSAVLTPLTSGHGPTEHSRRRHDGRGHRRG